MVKYKYIIVVFFIVSLVYLGFFFKTKIAYISNSPLVISISNPPSISEDMLVFWDNNKELITSKIGNQKASERILFVADNFKNRSEDKEEVNLQICLSDKIEKPCVLFSDRLMIVEKEDGGGVNELKISFMDYYLRDRGHVCLLYERSDGTRKKINC